MAKPTGWICPKGCAQQPCPHSAKATELVLPSSPYFYVQMEELDE